VGAEYRGHYSRTQGADRGNVIFIIEEIGHDKFERIGADLIYRHKISYEDLVLGTKIEAPTISGKFVKFTVEPGTQNGKSFRIQGHGMSRLNLSPETKPGAGHGGDFGNYIVELSLDIPTEYSEEEKELIEQLRELKSKKLV
jgi:molecular chaperone DnaJ